MLMLSMNEGDYITIGDDIRINLSKVGATCKVGVEAPKGLLVLRKTLHERSTGAAEEPFNYRAHQKAKRAAKKAAEQ